jgi:chromosomal replication initiation ATPase DnaA
MEDTPKGRLFQLGVPTDLHKYWISENFLDRICSEISAYYDGPFQVDLQVNDSPQVQFDSPTEPSQQATPDYVTPNSK